ncbi:hypothetical protein FSP39_000550 [Pinctada imbricata]|uniref:Uncharacterized protein n=1 Tax=Pinctada imbricata TaxID=66713 RepID=A0AA89BJY1_PINIB|nr:hypothetical protein FSP39_000550 [Pinctada imbricata]
MDTSCVKSVVDAAKILKEKFTRIDVMYLNAGIMPVKPGINWDNFINGIKDGKLVHMFTTGEGLLSQYDETTTDGLRKIFATNLFGHFVLIREVEEILGGDKPTQIIWTSSRASKQKAFSIRDIQHSEGADPYGSSKYAMDVLSVALNEKYNSRLRAFVVSLNCSPYNGSEALVWVTKQKPESLDPHSRYNSNTNVLGRCFISAEKVSKIVTANYNSNTNILGRCFILAKKVSEIVTANYNSNTNILGRCFISVEKASELETPKYNSNTNILGRCFILAEKVSEIATPKYNSNTNILGRCFILAKKVSEIVTPKYYGNTNILGRCFISAEKVIEIVTPKYNSNTNILGRCLYLLKR